MPWNAKYVPERAMIVATGSGGVFSEDARAQALAILRLLKRHEANLILVDYSDALSEVSLPELYWLSYHASSLGLPWDARLAVVLPRKRYRIESYQFFELVFRNVGYNVKLFEDRTAAELWLAPPPVGKAEDHCVHA